MTWGRVIYVDFWCFVTYFGPIPLQERKPPHSILYGSSVTSVQICLWAEFLYLTKFWEQICRKFYPWFLTYEPNISWLTSILQWPTWWVWKFSVYLEPTWRDSLSYRKKKSPLCHTIQNPQSPAQVTLVFGSMGPHSSVHPDLMERSIFYIFMQPIFIECQLYAWETQQLTRSIQLSTPCSWYSNAENYVSMELPVGEPSWKAWTVAFLSLPYWIILMPASRER